jgi:hypothetical protein
MYDDLVPEHAQEGNLERALETAELYRQGAEPTSGPPHTNRGVRIEPVGGSKPKKQEKSEDYASCVFDWYQASIPASPEAIKASFLQRFGGAFEGCNPINGYDAGVVHSTLKFSIYWGTRHAHPNVKATSWHSKAIAEWVREVFPQHKVSRADVAFDFQFEGAFDYLRGKVEPLARKAGVKHSFVGDPAENEPDFSGERRGRTYYFGSRKSDMMITLYEKGLELLGKGVKADPNLVRLEVRIRPQKQRKLQAAGLDPFDMVGFSKWISRAVGEILEEAPTVLPNYDKMERGPLAALEHMATQYARAIRSFLDGEDRGGEKRSWPELNAFLFERIYTREEREAMQADDPVDDVDDDA